MQNVKNSRTPLYIPATRIFSLFFCHISNNAKAALKTTTTGVVLMKTAAGI